MSRGAGRYCDFRGELESSSETVFFKPLPRCSASSAIPLRVAHPASRTKNRATKKEINLLIGYSDFFGEDSLLASTFSFLPGSFLVELSPSSPFLIM